MHFSVSAGRQYQSFSCSLSLSLTFFVWPKPYTESLTGKGGCVMTVYIDSLFLLDLVVDYLLLLLTGKVTGSPLRRWRLTAAAALGGSYSVLCVVTRISILTHPAFKIAAAVLLVLLAYGHCRYLFRCILIFLALSAALGGGLYAWELMSGGPLNLSVPSILLFSAAAYGLLSLAGHKLARHGPAQLRKLTVSLDGRSATLTALVDTGNTLTDPMTGQGVPVAEGNALTALLPPQVDCGCPAQCFPDLPDPARFRLLPYRSVGVDGGLLLAVRADALEVDGRPLPNRLIALSPTPVSDTGTYQALLFDE